MMNDTTTAQSAHVLQHSTAHYSAQQIATAHNVSDVTVRTRWFPWLCKVSPAALLKSEAGYTELANTLFSEFAAVDKKERHAWVADAKQRYSAEWSSAGIIDAELMPDTVGGTLARLSSDAGELELMIANELAATQAFISDLRTAEDNFTQAELETFRATGIKRGLSRFRIETTSEVDMLNLLRKQRLEGGQ